MKLQLIIIVVATLLLQGCGSSRRAVTSSLTDKSVSGTSVESSSTSSTEVSGKTTTATTVENETEITTTETTLTPVIVSDKEGNQSVVSVPTTQKTTTVRTSTKQTDEQTDEHSQSSTDENNYASDDVNVTDLSVEIEETRERKQSGGFKWLLVGIAAGLAGVVVLMIKLR